MKPSRKALQETNWGVFLALCIALFAIANYLSFRHHWRWDLTKGGSFSLSEQSGKVLKDLKEPLTVVVFLSPDDDLHARVKDLLSAYQTTSPLVKVEYIDPDRQRDRVQLLAKKYEVSKANVVVFEMGGQHKFVEKDQMVDYDYSGFQMGAPPTVKGFKAEEAFTNALLDLMNPAKPVIYFTSGHGERSGEGARGEGISSLKSRLEKEGAILKDWQSLGKSAVPDDADLLVISGPQKPFTEPEGEAVALYLRGGGKALILLDPLLSEGKAPKFAPSGLEGALSEWGITPRQDIAIDLQNAVPFVGAQTFFVQDFGFHAVVEPLSKNKLPVILTLARSLQTGTSAEGYAVQPVLSTSEGAWGETDLSRLEEVQKGVGDTSGPMVVAAAVSSENKENKARLVVAGDSDLAADSLFEEGGGNSLFCMNAVHWLLSQENRIAIPPKSEAETRLDITVSQGRFLFVLFVLLLPGLVTALGVWVYLKRRR